MNRARITVALWIAFFSLVSARAAGGETETLPPLRGQAAPQDHEALWADFDPCAEPLEVEVLKEWEEEGVTLKVLRYRVGIFKGQKAISPDR